MGGFVEPYLFDVLDDHGRRRGVLLPERRYLGRIRAPGRRSRKGSERTRTAAARIWIEGGSGFTATAARRHVRCSGSLADKLAGLRIVLADGELSEVHESFAVHGHAVALRLLGSKGADHVALFINVNH